MIKKFRVFIIITIAALICSSNHICVQSRKDVIP